MVGAQTRSNFIWSKNGLPKKEIKNQLHQKKKRTKVKVVY